MDITKIKKIQRCGWTLAPVEVDWLVAEVERLKEELQKASVERSAAYQEGYRAANSEGSDDDSN